jgi:predicted Rossmann fold nucleotide-binding protein DprA/Smf involved in DNA uptake
MRQTQELRDGIEQVKASVDRISQDLDLLERRLQSEGDEESNVDKISRAIREAEGAPVSFPELLSKTAIPRKSLASTLTRLVRQKRILRPSRGYYTLPDGDDGDNPFAPVPDVD